MVRDLVDSTLVVDPGTGSVTGVISEPIAIRWIMFCVACIWSGVNAWYWPHLLAGARWVKEERCWFTFLRRLLGVVPLLVAALTIIGIGRSHGPTLIAAALFLVAVVLLLLLFIQRTRRLARWFEGSWVTAPSTLMLPLLIRFGGKPRTDLRCGDDVFILGSFGASMAALLLFTLSAVRTEAADFVGVTAIAFGAVGSMIAGLSALVWLFSNSRVPILTIGGLWLLVISPFNDNHHVRPLASALVADRPSIEQAYRIWDAQAPAGQPIILVASAGGASRAAYWTQTVLRALDDRTAGRFSREVFAISSVSGGSLGTMGYAAWLANHPYRPGGCVYDAKARAAFDETFAGRDYLSPAVAGLLYPDAIQRFVPFALFPDRSRSIELGFIRGWRKAVDADSAPCGLPEAAFDKDMLQIWQAPLAGKAPWVPIALLNGTLVESGKRIITAPVRIDPAVFEDSHDFLSDFGGSVDVATAVMNSARFPIVSPAATVKLQRMLPKVEDPAKRAPFGDYHIVDGGYFENGGLETVYDLARYVTSIEPAIAPNRAPRPILIIEINNDDEFDELPDGVFDLARHSNLLANEQPHRVAYYSPRGLTLAPGFMDILGAFYQTRTSRGILAAKRLSAPAASGLGDKVNRVTFRLTSLIPEQRTAMSWSLSLSSRRAMDVSLTDGGRPAGPSYPMNPLIACERAVSDEIAGAIGSVARDPHAPCPGSRYAMDAIGYPVDLGRLTNPPTK